MKCWAVANQKGGVGKTTTVMSLGALQAARGERVLLVDLDPHASLSGCFGFSFDAEEGGVYDLFNAAAANGTLDPAGLIREVNGSDIALLGASTALATLDRQLGSRGGMGLVLSRALAQLRNHFDSVFLDCPPMLGVLMVNALAAGDHLVIPVQTEFLALKGLERMLATLDMIQCSRRRPLQYTIVPTQFDQRTRASQDALQQLQTDFAAHLWPDVIPIDTGFRDASRAGRPLPLLRPGARGAQAYGRLLDDLDPPRDSRAVAL